MKMCYILSIIYLIILFLLYKKKTQKICLISSLVYSIGLLFCYNTIIIFLLYLLNLNGSLLIYSIINYVIGTIILITILKKDKQIQEYYIDEKKILIFLITAVVIFLIGYFRFRGFEAISFETEDAAIHYKHAIEFSEELSILNENNSKDEAFGEFVRVIPISYINCGLLFNILSTVKSYTVFLWYNVACLIITALIFLITIIDIFQYKKKDYIFALIFTLFYILAFPLNSFLMGFCYLTICIFLINLLYLTVLHFNNEFHKNITLKIIIISLITFSIFYSYYLFIPAIYLALGTYYIYLWKKKKLNLQQTIIYGTITLIIPFLIGFNYFFITLFIDDGVGIIAKIINTWGYTYSNITPIFLFLIISIYLIYDYLKNKKIDYLKINLYTISFYIIIFLILYIFKLSDIYYFYKLFYPYWLLLMLLLGNKIFTYRHIFYLSLIIILITNIFIYTNPQNKISSLLTKTNIFNWNANTFIDEKIVFTKEEVRIIEKSIEYQDICKNDNKFLVLGALGKHIWTYTITNNIPVLGTVNGDLHNLHINRLLNFKAWEYASSFNCLVYYYEDDKVNIDETKYEMLYNNNAGAIIKRIK